MKQKEQKTENPKAILTNGIAVILVAGGIFWLMMGINEWAHFTFAKSILASALLAAVDLGLLLLGIALIPPLSWIIKKATSPSR